MTVQCWPLGHIHPPSFLWYSHSNHSSHPRDTSISESYSLACGNSHFLNPDSLFDYFYKATFLALELYDFFALCSLLGIHVCKNMKLCHNNPDCQLSASLDYSFGFMTWSRICPRLLAVIQEMLCSDKGFSIHSVAFWEYTQWLKLWFPC